MLSGVMLAIGRNYPFLWVIRCDGPNSDEATAPLACRAKGAADGRLGELEGDLRGGTGSGRASRALIGEVAELVGIQRGDGGTQIGQNQVDLGACRVEQSGAEDRPARCRGGEPGREVGR